MRLALLDIGSTAARLDIVELDHTRVPRADWTFKARTRLAENTRTDGIVTGQGIELAAEAVRKCVRAAGGRLPRPVVAFGTSAVRDAVNEAELRHELSAAAGVHIGSFSPEKEAALTYHAARRWHGFPNTDLITVDIGGGTIDVAAGSASFPGNIVSLPIGAARMTKVHLPDDPPTAYQLDELSTAVHSVLESSLTGFAPNEHGYTLGQSKVLRQLAKLAAGTRGKAARNADRLMRESVRDLIPRLAELTQDERAALPGVSRSRARRIVAGAVLAEAILDRIGVESVEICPWGLREGLVFRFAEACVAQRGDSIEGVRFDGSTVLLDDAALFDSDAVLLDPFR